MKFTLQTKKKVAEVKLQLHLSLSEIFFSYPLLFSFYSLLLQLHFPAKRSRGIKFIRNLTYPTNQTVCVSSVDHCNSIRKVHGLDSYLNLVLLGPKPQSQTKHTTEKVKRLPAATESFDRVWTLQLLED